jgi:hypothetical protein
LLFEDERVEEHAGDALGLGVELGDGLELVAQLLVGSPLVLSKDQLIGADA